MNVQLQAVPREKGTTGDVNKLRAAHKVPAIVYGHGRENVMLALDYNQLERVLDQAGTSTIIDLNVDGSKPISVLVADVQHSPVDDRITHVDFHQVRMDEKIKTEIALVMVGESPAVKEAGCNLIFSKDVLNVEALPGDLVSEIQVDISGLVQAEDSIRLKDLQIPKGITVLDDMEETVVSALMPKEEKVEEAPAAAEPELVDQKGKTEEEAAAETAS